MKARLVAKLGNNGLLGVPRGRSWDNKTFCLQYIDPYQKKQGGGDQKLAEEEMEDKAEVDEDMGKVVLVRNEREWQQCWEIALKEDDNELEVDIVELLVRMKLRVTCILTVADDFVPSSHTPHCRIHALTVTTCVCSRRISSQTSPTLLRRLDGSDLGRQTLITWYPLTLPTFRRKIV
jgi:hypothetical protein